METKSYPQSGGIHDRFNGLHRLISPVVFNLTVIVSRSRIYANIGHGFSINAENDRYPLCRKALDLFAEAQYTFYVVSYR